jgi:hypothetical protein
MPRMLVLVRTEAHELVILLVLHLLLPSCLDHGSVTACAPALKATDVLLMCC